MPAPTLDKASFAQIAALLQKPLESLDLPSLRLLEEYHRMNMEHARKSLDPILGEIAIRHRHAAQGKQIILDVNGFYTCPNCGTLNASRKGPECVLCGNNWAEALATAPCPEIPQ